MPRLVFTPAAEQNLIEIANYIEQTSTSIETAERFIARLVAKCEKLASLDVLMGRARPELLPELRSVPVGKFIIFIRYLGPKEAPDVLEVVNVLQARRDIDTFFAGRPDRDTKH